MCAWAVGIAWGLATIFVPWAAGGALAWFPWAFVAVVIGGALAIGIFDCCEGP